MNNEQLKLLIAEGEGLTLEFKERYTSKIDRDIVALTNSKGGYILLGIDDNGKITGEKLTNPMKAEIHSLARNCEPRIELGKIVKMDQVVVIEVPEGKEKPYSCSSGYFRRLDAMTQKMTQQEVRAVFRKAIDTAFEDIPCPDFQLEDISIKKIKAFLAETKTSYKVNKDNFTAFLASLSIYKGEGINNAGALMFASDVCRFVPYSEIILAAFKGMDKTLIYDRKDVGNDLLTQLKESIEFIKKHLNVRSEIRDFDRFDIFEIPLDALREAVVNAIVHRDYSMKGTSIYLRIFDDRIEIENPGGLPRGITKENFGKTSIRRNPIIADLFHRMDKMERLGSGIERMRGLMRDADLKAPVFESENFFRAVFFRDEKYSLKTGQKSSQKSSQKILDYIKSNPKITIKEMAENLNISDRSIKKHLTNLRNQEKIRRIGPDKGGYWEITGNTHHDR